MMEQLMLQHVLCAAPVDLDWSGAPLCPVRVMGAPPWGAHRAPARSLSLNLWCA